MTMRQHFFIFLFSVLTGLGAECIDLTGPRFLFSKALTNTSLSEDNEITCTTDEECQYFIEKSKCEEGRCKCASDWVLSSDRSICLQPAKEFGSPCQDNTQCSAYLSTGGVCTNNICKCKQGYHYLRGSCWKDAGLRRECVRDEQCFAAYEYIGLECKDQICQCRSEYYQRLNSGCRRARKNGEFCNLGSDCRDGTTCKGMYCSNSIYINLIPDRTLFQPITETAKRDLKCPKGEFELNGKCVLELGMKCEKDENCNHIPHARCLDQICGCEPVKMVSNENNRKCLQVARGNVPNITKTACKEDAQCSVFGENAFCQNQKCACRSESYWDDENKFCWMIKSLGETCSSDKDCHPDVKHSECVNSICTCRKGYHPKEEDCVPDAINVGDYCEKDEDCLLSNSYCDQQSNTCLCKKNYYEENKTCKPGVGSFCQNEKDCAHIRNTNCKSGNLTTKQCLCLDNQISSDDYKYCLPVVPYGGKCAETFQCTFKLGKLSECKDEMCQCRKTAHYSRGKCYPNKFVGDPCSGKLECVSGNDTESVICLKGYCACHYDYTLIKDGICVKTNSATVSQIPTLAYSLMFLLALRI